MIQHICVVTEFWTQTELQGKLRFVPPFHYELPAEEKRHDVRNEKTGCS
jgi:hypothetical protein